MLFGALEERHREGLQEGLGIGELIGCIHTYQPPMPPAAPRTHENGEVSC